MTGVYGLRSKEGGACLAAPVSQMSELTEATFRLLVLPPVAVSSVAM